MSTAVPIEAPVDCIETEINYLLATGPRPVSYAYPPPPGVPQHSGGVSPQRVRIAGRRAR